MLWRYGQAASGSDITGASGGGGRSKVSPNYKMISENAERNTVLIVQLDLLDSDEEIGK